jgi:hypothetical protein
MTMSASAASYQTATRSVVVSNDTRVDWVLARLAATTTTTSIAAGDPTFVQPPARATAAQASIRRGKLVARIDVPQRDSLIRGKVPVVGLAYGPSFAEYRLEYGAGVHPDHWNVIARSAVQQAQEPPDAIFTASPDVTVPGNLATWDVGLGSYVYLPDYAPGHSVDLNGVYTLRLVVTGTNSDESVDSIQVQVGEAIPNAFGGTLESSDHAVRLAIPEHSLANAFRVFAIRSLDGLTTALPPDPRLLGRVYEVREPGERFRMPASLEMTLQHVDRDAPMNKVAICSLDDDSTSWLQLDSSGTGWGVRASVDRLAAYYSLCLETPEAPRNRLTEDTRPIQVNPSTGYYLVNETFEHDLGGWSATGASLTVDRLATGDGSGSLRITTTDAATGPYITIRSTPYDAREYPILRFDYRLPGPLKVDLLAAVAGRWYRVHFTGTELPAAYRRVNIADIGRVENVIADDRWHTAEVNLFDLLRTATGNSVVEKLVLTDFNVTGFMKLQPAPSAGPLSLLVDNFQLAGSITSSTRAARGGLVVDDFNKGKATNNFNQSTWVFADSATSVLGRYAPTYVEQPGKGRALAVAYDLRQPDSFIGYVSGLPNLDATSYRVLSLAFAGVRPASLLVGLRDSEGNESKVRVNALRTSTMSGGWQRVEVPLVAFDTIRHWESLTAIIVALDRTDGVEQGTLLLDDLAFQDDSGPILIDDFRTDLSNNNLGGGHKTFREGDAWVSARSADPGDEGMPPGALRLSFGGHIGDLFTYGGWATDLRGLNVQSCESVSFGIRGDLGEEPVNLYLDDGTFRWGLPIQSYTAITRDWQQVLVPLADFRRFGVDLSHLSAIQFVFEWQRMTGSVYVKDIELLCRHGASQEHDSAGH